jgi:hypothetical protein
MRSWLLAVLTCLMIFAGSLGLKHFDLALAP